MALYFMLAGHDVIGQAQTGTDKTAARAIFIMFGYDLSENRAHDIKATLVD